MNEVKVTVKAEGKGLDKVEAEAKQTGAKVGRELEKGFKDGEQASASASTKMKDDLDEVGKEGARTGTKIKDGLNKGVESGLSAGGEAAKGAALGMGAAIGTALLAGLGQQFQQKQIGGLLAVQEGASREEGGKLGRVVGDAFADNFGDSMEDVSGALKAVLDNKLIDTGASEADLKHLTEMAVTASKVVGDEAGNIGRAAEKLLRNGLAGNAEEAMDVIVKASENGIDRSHDLIDTIVEYSTKFRDLGITGPEAMGLLSQALAGGARDTDTAADALKEFVNIATSSDQAAATRGFEALGLNAQQMSAAVAKGGDSARQALKLTLDGLQAIHDPTVRAQVAFDLFGTKSEDMGRALTKMDLDTAAKEMEGFGGTTQKAADDIKASTPAWDKLWRTISSAPGKGVQFLIDHSNTVADLTKYMNDLNKENDKGADSQDGFNERVAAAEDAVRRSTDAIDKNTLSLEENIDASSKAADGVLGLWDAQNGHAEAVQKANESLKENGKTLDFHTEKGRANRDALSDVAKTTYDQIAAMEAQGATSQEIQGVIAAQREEFVALATKMGMSATEANALADKLRLIPGNYKANVYADTSQANAAIQNTAWMLSQLRDKTVTLTVHQSAQYAREAKFGGFAHGGIVGAAGGGPRSGRTVVGEYGPEILDIAPGSQVHSNPDSQRMVSGMAGGGGWSGPTKLEVHVLGDTNQWLVKAMLQAKRDGLLELLVS